MTDKKLAEILSDMPHELREVLDGFMNCWGPDIREFLHDHLEELQATIAAAHSPVTDRSIFIAKAMLTLLPSMPDKPEKALELAEGYWKVFHKVHMDHLLGRGTQTAPAKTTSAVS